MEACGSAHYGRGNSRDWATRYYVGQFLMTFKDYPQRQKAESFNLDKILENMTGNKGQ